MAKRNRQQNYYTAPSNRIVEAINRNRHYTDDIKTGLLNLYKLNTTLQDYTRKAYQILSDHLRKNEVSEFTVNHIDIKTIDAGNVTTEQWSDTIMAFFPNSKIGQLNEYGKEAKLITIRFNTPDNKHCFKVAYLPLSQYNDEHYYAVLDDEYLY